MPLLTTRGNGGVFGLGWSSAPVIEELGGMVLLTPSSIAYSGTSATIGANGSVEFDAVTSLSLNGIFSADYENYMMVVTGTSSTDWGAVGARFRTSTDENGSNYTIQRLDASGINVSAGRGTQTFARFMLLDNSVGSGGKTYIYGPYLSSPTAFRSVGVPADYAGNGVTTRDWAGTHSLSSSYTGVTLANEFGSDTLSGAVSTYGFVGA